MHRVLIFSGNIKEFEAYLKALQQSVQFEKIKNKKITNK